MDVRDAPIKNWDQPFSLEIDPIEKIKIKWYILVERSFGVNCTVTYVKTNRCRPGVKRVHEKFLQESPKGGLIFNQDIGLEIKCW